MKICFVGHSFHLRTRSTLFLREILAEMGEVHEFHSSPDDKSSRDDELIALLATSNFDIYVFLQTEYLAAQLLELNLGRFIIIPMYDGAVGRPDTFWKRFVDSQFISFSRAHHEYLTNLDCKSAYFKYFPQINCGIKSAEIQKERSGFFWERRPDKTLNLPLVLRLSKKLRITSLHVHLAPDFPDETFSYRRRGKLRSDEITLSTSVWFENREELEELASTALFYFAPRSSEGIGLAVLEAMARGQIIVAPDQPTMNEYIGHGVTGFLYDLQNPTIDLDAGYRVLRDISSAAASKAQRLRRDWELQLPRLRSVIIGDQQRWSTKDQSAQFINEIRRKARSRIWEMESQIEMPEGAGIEKGFNAT